MLSFSKFNQKILSSLKLYGNLYHELIEQFVTSEDINNTLFIIQMGMIFFHNAYNIDKETTTKYFADFCEITLIDNLLRLATVNGKDSQTQKTIYQMAIACLSHLDPSTLSSEMKKQTIRKLLLWQFTPHKLSAASNPEIAEDNFLYAKHQAMQVWKKWMFSINHMLSQDADKEFAEDVFHDLAENLYNSEWDKSKISITFSQNNIYEISIPNEFHFTINLEKIEESKKGTPIVFEDRAISPFLG